MAFYTMFFIWHPIQCSWHGIPYRQCWHGIPYRYSSLCAIPCRHHSWHDIAYSVLDMAVRTDTVLDMTLHTMFLTWQCIPTLFMTWHCIQTVFLTWHCIQCSWHDIGYNVLDMTFQTMFLTWQCIQTMLLIWQSIQFSWPSSAYNVLAWHSIQTMFLTWHCIQCSWHGTAYRQCSWHGIAYNVLDMALHTDNALDMALHTDNVLDMALHTDNALDMALHTEHLWHDSAYRQEHVAVCRWSCGRSPRTGSSPRWPSGGSTSTATHAGSATWSGTPQRKTSFCLLASTTRWPPHSTCFSSLVIITSLFMPGSCVMALTAISVSMPGFRLCC